MSVNHHQSLRPLSWSGFLNLLVSSSHWTGECGTPQNVPWTDYIPFQLMGLNSGVLLTKTIGLESKPSSKKFKVKTRTQLSPRVNTEGFCERPLTVCGRLEVLCRTWPHCDIHPWFATLPHPWPGVINGLLTGFPPRPTWMLVYLSLSTFLFCPSTAHQALSFPMYC